MNIQPFYVIPILIKQPTWGGDAIVKIKRLLDPVLHDQKIGQSYELSPDSRVSIDPAAQECFVLTDSGLNGAQQFGPSIESLDLQSVVMMNPSAILGESWAQKDPTMQLLVKFNQAKNNSYQVHVRPGSEFHGWQAKPESWLYLADGQATVGLKQGADLGQYKRACEEIEAEAQRLGNQVKDGTITIEAARESLSVFVEPRHPRQFVNCVTVPKGSVVDLWQGGIHHSWEADASLPDGNIIFEVQMSVRDERSSMRSFDQGHIKDQGDLRPLHIEDYFQALNTSPLDNQPEKLVTQPQGHSQDGVRQTALFCTPYYQLQQLEFAVGSSLTRTTSSFHHLYVHDGEARVEWHDQVFDIMTGRSLFIPAACGNYMLSTTSSAFVLETSLPPISQEGKV
jgi:quercetin dioxygenase-like cupin family protein